MALTKSELLAQGFKETSENVMQRLCLMSEDEYLKEYPLAPRRSSVHYTLTDGNWKLYVPYLEETVLEDGEFYEPMKHDTDCAGFWCKSDNPRLEIRQRLLDFKQTMLKCAEENPKEFWSSFNIEHIATDSEICCWYWIKPYNIRIPSDFLGAKSTVEDLMYKYRKMVELYNSLVRHIDLL